MGFVATQNYVKFLQVIPVGLLYTGLQNTNSFQQVRHRITKHWAPKWKRLRRQKFIKIELPNFEEKLEDLSQEEIRSRLKEKGLLPPRPWLERPFHVSCTGGIFEPYVPPEGDGKKSFISSSGAKQKLEFLEKKSKSMMAVRKIRNYDEEFDTFEFAQKAQDIYIKAHERMMTKDKHLLREVITERAYPEMMHNIKDKTIHWKFLKSLEPPRVVHARCTDIITKENLFGQVTVRFHTQQMLAIYDRFGRLMHGSEILSKDVLEYVVFEKHISNEYGIWRLHDKIIPDWLPKKEPTPITYRIDDEPSPLLTTSEIVDSNDSEKTTNRADEKPEEVKVEKAGEQQKLVTA